MSSKLKELKQYLKRKENISNKQLFHQLQIDNYDEFILLNAEILKQGIKNFINNGDVNECKYLLKSLECIKIINNEQVDYRQIINDLNEINQLITKTINKNDFGKNKKERDKSINFLLCLQQTIQNKIPEIIFSIEKTILNTKNKDEAFNLLEYLIFEKRDYQIIAQIIKAHSQLIRTKSNSTYIIETIINYYIDLLKNKYPDVEVTYFEKIIELFIKTEQEKYEKTYEKILLNRLLDVLNCLKKYKSANNYNSIKFLNEMVSCLENKREYISEEEKINTKYNIECRFNEDVYNQLANSKINNCFHEDLTNKYCITIDLPKTCSFEDAVSLERLPNGNYILGLYFSNLSDYVMKGTPIDIKAEKRGKTIYLVDKKIPMVPFPIANDLCSLKENKDRYVIAKLLEFDSNFEFQKLHEIKRAVINVKTNFSYNDVDRVLARKEKIEELEMLQNLVIIMKKLKRANAYKNIFPYIRDVYKSYLHGGEDKVPNYSDGYASDIVRELSILTNHLVAKYFYNNKLPFIYLNNLFEYDYDLKDSYEIKSCDNLETVTDAVYKLYLPSTYSTENKGHSLLNLDCYGHVTNPLRNYACLTIQRLIIDLIIEGKTTDEELITKYNYELPKICEHLNKIHKTHNQYINSYNRLYCKKMKH